MSTEPLKRLIYIRRRDEIWLRCINLTTGEIGQMIEVLWRNLPPAEQKRRAKALQGYLESGDTMPAETQALANGFRESMKADGKVVYFRAIRDEENA